MHVGRYQQRQVEKETFHEPFASGASYHQNLHSADCCCRPEARTGLIYEDFLRSLSYVFGRLNPGFSISRTQHRMFAHRKPTFFWNGFLVSFSRGAALQHRIASGGETVSLSPEPPEGALGISGQTSCRITPNSRSRSDTAIRGCNDPLEAGVLSLYGNRNGTSPRCESETKSLVTLCALSSRSNSDERAQSTIYEQGEKVRRISSPLVPRVGS